MAIDGEIVERQTLFWGDPKLLLTVTAAMKLKIAWSLEEKLLPGASVRNPARDKVMRQEADIRKACSDFRDPSGNS